MKHRKIQYFWRFLLKNFFQKEQIFLIYLTVDNFIKNKG